MRRNEYAHGVTVPIERVRAALRSLHPGPLSHADADTVVDIVQHAIDPDLELAWHNEDTVGSDHVAMFFTLGTAVYELAGRTETPKPNLASTEDDEQQRLHLLAANLEDQPTRELAYALTHVLAIHTPWRGISLGEAYEQGHFIVDLRRMLSIADRRGDELVATLTEALATR